MYQYLVSSEVVPTSGKNLEEYENGGLIDKSAKCDLLVSAEDGKEMPAQCNFCLGAGSDINRGTVVIGYCDYLGTIHKV